MIDWIGEGVCFHAIQNAKENLEVRPKINIIYL